MAKEKINTSQSDFQTLQGFFLALLLSSRVQAVTSSKIPKFDSILRHNLNHKEISAYNLAIRVLKKNPVKDIKSALENRNFAVFDNCGVYIKNIPKNKMRTIIIELEKAKLITTREVALTNITPDTIQGGKVSNLIVTNIFIYMGKFTKDKKNLNEDTKEWTKKVQMIKKNKNASISREVATVRVDSEFETITNNIKNPYRITSRDMLPDLCSSILSYCNDLNYHYNGTKKMRTGSTWVYVDLLTFAKKLGRSWAFLDDSKENKETKRKQLQQFCEDVCKQLDIIIRVKYKYVKEDAIGSISRELSGGYFTGYYRDKKQLWVAYDGVYNTINSANVHWYNVPLLYYRVNTLINGTTQVDYKGVILALSEQINIEGGHSFCLKEDGFHLTIENILKHTSLPKTPAECDEKKWKRYIKTPLENILNFLRDVEGLNILTKWRYSDKEAKFETFNDWVTSTIVYVIDVDKYIMNEDQWPKQLRINYKSLFDLVYSTDSIENKKITDKTLETE